MTAKLTVAADATLGKWELELLSLEAMRSALKPTMSAPFTELQARSEVKQTGAAPKPAEKPQVASGAAPAAPLDEVASRAQDGLLVNGSVNNAATSPFTLAPRFGNTASGRGLYNFALYATIGNSALNAQPYSLTGFATQKPQTSQLTGGFSVQGPLKIPGVLRNGPTIFATYNRVENGLQTTLQGLVPTLAQRNGYVTVPVFDPVNGQTYNGTTANPVAVPVSPQAQALLNLYPMPNIPADAQYNYQIPVVTDTHTDAVSSRVDKTVGRKDQLWGTFGANSTRTSYGNLFNFVDDTHGLGIQGTANWAHTLNARIRTTLTYQYSRQSNRLTPYWDNRENISGQAGIAGNDQAAPYWGPPTLTFNTICPLTDGQETFTRNESNKGSFTVHWNHYAHNVTGGADFQRGEFNYLTQANPRGTFTFTGAATASAKVVGSGSDFADFLVGVPDTSSIAYGNADKYLRQTVYDFYVTDDWRVNPTLTLNIGARYEYGAPVTEVKNRLANLDVAAGFASVATVVASSPNGTLTGQSYPDSLTRADRNGIEPRLALSWRPIPGSSMVVSTGYGITYDTSVYQGIALNLAQQAPFSKSVVAQNGSGCGLTLASGFPTSCGTTAPDTFGADPNFHVGYLQTWNLIVRRDLPGSLQLTATYLGNKGTHGAQLFLPNTYAPGVTTTCANCPTGFEYLASGGDSTRESGQIQLRRRLKSGFTAAVTYTYSKSIDDDSALGGQGAATLGSATIAQNWLNLKAERGLSGFDQRNLLNATVQYTTAMGKGGGTLMSGWRGAVYKEWTVLTTITEGSGLPETPIDGNIPVAGYTSFIRPNLTGAPLYTSAGFVNPLAFSAPNGSFGDARRDSITGPNQFTMSANIVRTFRLLDKVNLDTQIAATNPLNHVSYSTWYTNVASTQFGLPASVNPPRSLQILLRLRY